MDLIIFLEELGKGIYVLISKMYLNIRTVPTPKYGKFGVIESKKHSILNYQVYYDLVANYYNH